MAVRVEQHAEPIPGYRLLDRLGGGGFGEVWRVEAPGGLHKAIKFVFGDLSSAGDSQRAEQELKALRRVQSVRHPYILTLERYDIIDGQLMIVMELADRNLWDRFKECRAQGLPGIPRDELLRYMEETAEALDLMNREYQLQHLDIKPQNLFLVHNHVKVADFGLVKDLENSQASVTGGITPVYAAPETFDGKVTRYSDQYSLGIVYQELLTGQRPFLGNNVRQLILQHIQGVPNVNALPPGDQPHVARALSKSPEDRFPTCRELVLALRAAPAAPPVSPSVQATLLSTPSTVPTPHPASGETPASGTWQAEPSSGPLTASLRALDSESASSQGITQNIRAIDPSVLRRREEAQKASAPPELTGPGSLFPALVIGLGQMGLSVLQKTRETLHTFAAPLNQLTNLRFLLLDTDPEVIRTAGRCLPAAALGAAEVLIAPLNRPSHYLKPREGRPALESWLNPKMLYRIPRSQVTTGVRSLGRLAFIDNYRSVMRRLQLDLETALDPNALQSAARATKLGLRTSRPRVYVVTSLGGGTGSGMFLDVAYNVRALLRQMGYENPDVTALLLLPPVERTRTRVAALGNTYAALTELNHFAAPDAVFRARYHDREAPVEDPEPPFSRTVMMPLPDEADEVATREVVELCGQMLYRDLTTPFGRAADLGRAGLPAPPWEQRGQYAQTFGLFQLTWPRHSLLRAVSRELCRRTVSRWLSKDSKPIRTAVAEWVQEQWALLELGADSFIHRLQADLASCLARPVEALFREAAAPVSVASAQGEPPGKGRSKSELRGPTRDHVAAALAAMEDLVGKPEDDSAPAEPPRLLRLLRESAERVAAEWVQKLVELPVQLIEDPRFRLAGAEEAIRLVVSNVEQILQHHEPLARDLAEKALDAHDHLRVAAGREPRPESKLSGKTPEQIVELCRLYPKARLQHLLLGHISAAFVSIRGHLSDELREINFCRVRLTELLRLLEEVPPGEAALTKTSPSKQGVVGRVLFVSGCRDLPEAVSQYLEAVTPEQLVELDERMEEMLRGSFTALVHVCLQSQSVLKPLEQAMLQTATDFAAERLPETSAASLFLEQHPDPELAASEAVDLYHQAAPELAVARSARGGPSPAELCVLAAPPDPASEQFAQLLSKGLPEVEIQPAASTEDIMIYRERVNVALSDLEHLGPVGHDAYAQMSSTDHFTPHSRTDVKFRR